MGTVCRFTCLSLQLYTHKNHTISSLICARFTWIPVCSGSSNLIFPVSILSSCFWLWPRFLRGSTHTVTTYRPVCGYCAQCICVYVLLHVCTCVPVPEPLGFTTVPVIFSEVMTSAEKWVACQKGWPIIVWYFYWSKRVLKIQTIVFLWWSCSTLVSFVFCRNDSPEAAEFYILVWIEDRRVDRVCGFVLKQASSSRSKCFAKDRGLILFTNFFSYIRALLFFTHIHSGKELQ